jgi:hypothetical protein
MGVPEDERQVSAGRVRTLAFELPVDRTREVFVESLRRLFTENDVGDRTLPRRDLRDEPSRERRQAEACDESHVTSELACDEAREVRRERGERGLVLEHVVDEPDVDARLARTSKRRPEEVDPGEVVGLPLPDLSRRRLLREQRALERRHQPVERFGEVPMVDDDHPLTVVAVDPEVRVHDAHAKVAVRLLAEHGIQEFGFGRHGRCCLEEPGDVPRHADRLSGIEPSDVVGVLAFPGGLPEVMVVVARDVVDVVVEERPTGGEREPDERREGHRRHVVVGEGELEDVAMEDERWRLRVPVRLDDCAKAVD